MKKPLALTVIETETPEEHMHRRELHTRGLYLKNRRAGKDIPLGLPVTVDGGQERYLLMFSETRSKVTYYQ